MNLADLFTQFYRGAPVTQVAERRDRMNPGKNPFNSMLEGGAGGGFSPSARGVPRAEVLSRIEDAATEYARGNMSAAQVRKVIKDLGWSGGVGRHNRSELEVFDPDGNGEWVGF